MLGRAGLVHHAAIRSAAFPAVATRQDAAERLANVVTTLAGIVGLVVALASPASYMIAAYGRLAGVLDLYAETYADDVAETAGESPVVWNAFFDNANSDLARFRIAMADDAGIADRIPEQRRVFARDGHVIIDIPPAQPLDWPVLARRMPVMQNGHHLGDVEVLRSLRPMLVNTAAIGGIALLLSLGLTLLLRLIPLRLLHEALARARYLSAHDVLTGLPNRALFNDRLKQATALSRRSGARVAVLCLDLDRFKDVNDMFGHAAGDRLLLEVTARMQACLRESDTLARLGGDEFAIILTASQWPEGPEAVSRRLVEAVQQPLAFESHPLQTGVSIGIAVVDPDRPEEDALKDAYIALHRAKQDGRGRWSFFAPEMNARLLARRMLEADLRAAVAEGAFTLVYQPQVNLDAGRVIGAEALLRWTRPGHGPVPPDQFIGLAEETGLIGAIGAWVLREACQIGASWPDDLRIAINVSPVQLRQADFHHDVAAVLAETGLAPERLELEITEGVLLNDTEETLAILSRLRGLGVRLAMDDFGTGYSSLGYLQRFRFDKIKIDRSFIRRLASDANAMAIVRAVIGLSDALGVCILAEGVEERVQAEMLFMEGCTEVQGYLYGRPMPAEAFRRLLDAGGGEGLQPFSPPVAAPVSPVR